ncbi:DNA mismatch endonuclease Vsr [bacterium]|nr:DNA mismatch endonuclease Vsr [bacterium]
MDNVSPRRRSEIMAKVKSHGNRSTEARMAQVLKKAGLVGWRRKYSISGKPDFVFPRARIALFVDGCFWHGCPRDCRIPQSNRDYWVMKIDRNRKRDRTIGRELRARGWTVVRVWEHEFPDSATLKAKLTRIRKSLLALSIHRS